MWWEHLLSKEIAIEIKACLYFFCILVFYWAYRILHGSWDADIVKMFEMVLCAYAIGYLQVYVGRNFDESEQFGRWEIGGALICSVLYAVISYLGNWYDKNRLVTILYFAYMLLCFVCVFLIHKIKREIDTKHLNQELEAFKKGRG